MNFQEFKYFLYAGLDLGIDMEATLTLTFFLNPTFLNPNPTELIDLGAKKYCFWN